MRFSRLAFGLCAAVMLAPTPGHAQLWTWSKEQMLDFTRAWTGERFPDGRPKVPDSYLARAREMSMEEVIIPSGGRGGGGGLNYSQYAGDWILTQPGKKMVGRAFTVQFMPARQDLDTVVLGHMKEKGVTQMNNQFALDQLQPGDVLVCDLYGKKEGGTIVGDNLFYYVYKATKNGGMVIDGSIRDLEGIAEMPMPAYIRSVHPTAIGGVTLSGVNVPIRIGNVTVMPGDLVVGDREGVAFIPPSMAQQILDRADETHIHDEWTRKKFDENKYKSSEIYGSPKDPALQKEYKEYLAKRLEEIRKSRGQ